MLTESPDEHHCITVDLGIQMCFVVTGQWLLSKTGCDWPPRALASRRVAGRIARDEADFGRRLPRSGGLRNIVLAGP